MFWHRQERYYSHFDNQKKISLEGFALGQTRRVRIIKIQFFWYTFYTTLLPHYFINDKERVGQLTLAACSCYRPWTIESIIIYVLQQQVLTVQADLYDIRALSTTGLNLWLLQFPFRKKKSHFIPEKSTY